ncbi:alpha/beta hydrolase [Nocardia grenadensis]|uniref:alpha/beta hydrolase n=1 Tax=Nocardia grenadensis TaxID=931537 RepID=UPI000A8D4E7F|nr:alpha/beta hydrolase [Nocardia grenadensis]
MSDHCAILDRDDQARREQQRDPVTPLRGAELLDEKFGQRPRLVSVDGSGHGV